MGGMGMGMKTTRSAIDRGPGSAEAFLAALVTQDFPAVRSALAPDVHLRALLPGGLREWTGAEPVAHRFEQWFGHTEQFAAIEHGSGQVGGRVQLRWRLRLQADRLGPGWFVVEQVAYCDTDEHGLSHLDLLCTGYLSDSSDG